MDGIEIRPATVADAPAVAAIYAPVVTDTHISFELEPPTAEEMAGRIAAVTATHPWLVAEDGDGVVGYVYAASHSSREAYRWSVDTSVYLAAAARGRGVGRALYEELLSCLRSLGFVSAFAGIALPNDASVALHERVGFRPIGAFPLSGFKFGRWIDVGLWRCELVTPPMDPEEPRRWDG